jgi:hypothetical protein
MYKNTNPYGQPDPNAKINIYGEPKTNEPIYQIPSRTDPNAIYDLDNAVWTNPPTPPNPEFLKFDVDLSKGSTLFELGNQFRKFTEPYPDDVPVYVYIVCGNEFKCDDFQLFLYYLKTLKRLNLQLVFRGIVHSEFGWLLFEPNLTIKQGSTFQYEPSKLYLWLKTCQYKDDILKNIAIGFKFNYDFPKQLTLGDLESIGFKLEIAD